jgi:hypothetical protein
VRAHLEHAVFAEEKGGFCHHARCFVRHVL